MSRQPGARRWSERGSLTRRISFTLLAIVVFRILAAVPTPGISARAVLLCSTPPTGGIAGLLNLLSGGALAHLGLGALGVMPLVIASITMQMLNGVLPSVAALKTAPNGQVKLAQITRYLAVGIAVIQAGMLVWAAQTGRILSGCETPSVHPGIIWMGLAGVGFVAGASLIMWLSERITDFGIGSGASVLIATSVLAALPVTVGALAATGKPWLLLAIGAAFLATVAIIAVMESASRNITVVFPSRTAHGAAAISYLPVRLNPAGVMPVVAASALLHVPTMLSAVYANDTLAHWATLIASPFTWVGAVALIVTVVGAAVLVTPSAVDADRVAEHIAASGGFIPGVTPGPRSAQYLMRVVWLLAPLGLTYLVVVCTLPTLLAHASGQAVLQQLGGSSILIMVTVAAEVVRAARASRVRSRVGSMLTSVTPVPLEELQP